MDIRIIKEWERLANTILDASRGFMKSCNASFDRGFIGELLTLPQLIKAYENVLSDDAPSPVRKRPLLTRSHSPEYTRLPSSFFCSWAFYSPRVILRGLSAGQFRYW